MRRGGVAGLAVVVAVLAAATTAGCGGDDDTGGGEASGAGGAVGPIRLEPIDAETPNPFIDVSLDLATSLGESIGSASLTPPESSEGVTSGLSGRVVAGDQVGLYGGSLNTEVCDVDQLVGFLTDPANADKADAWASVQGITAAEIPDYIGRLTPVRLRLDTRVTNHTFEGGEAQPLQSILQAGTAVLVDDHGVPRARCFCGNPLLEPAPLAAEASDDEALDLGTLAENPEDAWDGLAPEKVATVQPGEQLDSITVTDLDTGEPFERPVGTKGTEDRPAAPGTGDTGDPGPGGITGPSTSSAPGGGDTGGCQRRTEQRPDGAIIEYCE